MSEPGQQSEGLVAAKTQFLEAEKRLRELAQGAVELTRASVMLKKARMGLTDGADALRELSGRLSEYIGSLAQVTDQLSAASSAPPRDEETATRLDAIQKQLTEIGNELREATPADDAAAVLGGRTEELQIVTETLTAHLGTLEDLATELSQSRALRGDDGLDTVLARIDTMETKISKLGAAPREIRIPGEIEASLRAIPDLGNGLAGIVASLRAAELEAAPARLATLEAGLHDLKEVLDRSSSTPPPSVDHHQILDGIERHLAAFSSQIRGLETPGTIERLAAVDRRLAALDDGLQKLTRRLRTGSGDDGQMELLPDVEDGLIALAQEVHAREVTSVDMMAELRRSLGRKLEEAQDSVVRSLGQRTRDLEREVSRMRTLLWIAALAALGSLALAVLQLFS